MTVMWASGFARVGDDDYYARDQPQERCPCHRGENEWRGTDYPFGSQLSIERHVERLARDRDVDDAQRHGQTHADADRAAAVSMGCELVEYPSTRRPVGVSGYQCSDWQDENEILEGDVRGGEGGGGEQHNPHHDRRDTASERQHGDHDYD